MQLSTTILDFLLVAASTVSGAAIESDAAIELDSRGLGINCRGSTLCSGAGSLKDIADNVAKISQDRWYNAGELIACVQDLAGSGKCAFLQGNTGGLPGSDILPLIHYLQQHGCGGCGSVPIYFGQGDNNPDTHGILTVNYKRNTQGCNGAC
ncbi:hypothetical protein V499_03594 [Pseudogymnoascus sp. VKM F-103]|uniref:Killer toxin Kp4 domain-containing protein n=1 Tax=Pseudogymnoascus verrucosus TaxID=342668 RepID=A0A1B8GWW1_9PEZI|nr:uncharacterized protein VE01_01543 [Pseudogymnoascus verrucosus]KFY76903.1 hypothetical protein V499_03594 [Pseudogymnoascus sp. VKM F-103]OBU00342.1 hypothetical protein VE01_01543 [Pseudogymnoascus verrucosus]